MRLKHNFLPWLLLVLILILIFVVIYFRLYSYLNFEILQRNHLALSAWTQKYYILSMFVFLFLYVLAVTSSTPGPIILNIAGGFLFGLFWGTVYSIIGSTIGAIVVFLAINTTFGRLFKNRARPWITKMEKGIKHNAFNYLLILRVTPLFPVWLVNIVPPLLNVPLSTFLSATVIGSIPGSFFYAAIGDGLIHMIDNVKEPDFRVIFTSQIFIAVVIVTILSFLPIVYNKWKKK